VGVLFRGADVGAGCSYGRASFAWKNRGEASLVEPVSDGVWLYMPDSGSLGAGAVKLLLGPGVLRGRPPTWELAFPVAPYPL
jgi:hypothetical protein